MCQEWFSFIFKIFHLIIRFRSFNKETVSIHRWKEIIRKILVYCMVTSRASKATDTLRVNNGWWRSIVRAIIKFLLWALSVSSLVSISALRKSRKSIKLMIHWIRRQKKIAIRSSLTSWDFIISIGYLPTPSSSSNCARYFNLLLYANFNNGLCE